jgi:hypothetical protein
MIPAAARSWCEFKGDRIWENSVLFIGAIIYLIYRVAPHSLPFFIKVFLIKVQPCMPVKDRFARSKTACRPEGNHRIATS